MMTKTNTPNPKRAARRKGVSEPVQEQLSLVDSPAAEGQGDGALATEPSSMADSAIGRAFVPSNRELLLRQLSALVLSPDFPLDAGIPVDDSQHSLVISDGLRIDEINMLANGRPQRFPVLAEIRSAAAHSGVFGIRDVVALHFRSEAEASDFRFRPVGELDTAYVPCLAGPSMFGLEGDSRFSCQEAALPGPEGRNGTAADRIAGAVCCLLQLSAVEPRCRDTIADLLSGRSSVQWMNAAAEHLAVSPENGSSGACGAVVRAFLENDGRAPSHLVQELGRYLVELADTEMSRAAPRWLEMAEAVLGNRMVLDGEVLSDKRSIALRAAILALVVDDVKDLSAFVHAERPAGLQVVVGAAFLIGMRSGVADLTWAGKRPHLDLLSPLLVSMHQREPAIRRNALDAFQVEPDESASPLQLVLYWRDMQILRWVPLAEPDTDASLADGSNFAMNDDVPGILESTPVRNDPPDHTIPGPGGRVIEVLASSVNPQMTSLRLVLGETDRLRKPKEIMEAASIPALCWRVGVTAEGVGALYLDAPGECSRALLAAMSLKAAEALSHYLVPVKPKRRPKAKMASKPATVGDES